MSAPDQPERNPIDELYSSHFKDAIAEAAYVLRARLNLHGGVELVDGGPLGEDWMVGDKGLATLDAALRKIALTERRRGFEMGLEAAVRLFKTRFYMNQNASSLATEIANIPYPEEGKEP